MITHYQKKYSSWLDVSLPQKEEIEKIMREYGLDSSIANDLLHPTPKPKVVASGDKLYTVVHIPVLKHSHSGTSSEQEIDFVIGRKVLITVRYDTIDALYKYAKESEVKEMLEREEGGNHTFVEIMTGIYTCLFDELLFIEDRLNGIEKKIFQGKEKEMVLHISKVGRDLLNFRRVIEPHGQMFAELKLLGTEVLGKKFNTEMDELIEEWQRLVKSANDHANFLSELRETNNSLLSTKQNEVMKTLTVLASMTIPASIIASIFNMAVDLPLVDRADAFYIIIASMIGLSLCMFAFFKIKKWL
ncbi:MAG TPA: magnesium transporter CorA family protein [Candidatus Paceibacterota bacterium]